MKYGFVITWTDYGGNETTAEVGGRETLEDAINDCRESAEHFGWTPPKWWQWWRWGDTRVELDKNIPRNL